VVEISAERVIYSVIPQSARYGRGGIFHAAMAKFGVAASVCAHPFSPGVAA
jgi:hypothetical protein